MSRPKGCIYPDCLNCPLPDCTYDELEPTDLAESRQLDCDIRQFRGTYSRYIWQMKYFTSQKGKAAQKRYRESDKGRAAIKRKEKKDIATGKNAEKCRRYYERHKAEILAKRKAERVCI